MCVCVSEKSYNVLFKCMCPTCNQWFPFLFTVNRTFFIMTNNMSRSTRHSWRSLHITSLQYAGKVRNFDVLSCLGYCSVSSLGYLIDDLQKKKSLNVVVSCGPSLIALQFFSFLKYQGISCSPLLRHAKFWSNSLCCAWRTLTKHVLCHRWDQPVRILSLKFTIKCNLLSFSILYLFYFCNVFSHDFQSNLTIYYYYYYFCRNTWFF